MTFKLDQKTDCDIISAEILCKEVFEENGYIVNTDSNSLTFLRRNSKKHNRFMPIIELLRGFGEGKMIFSKNNDYLKIKIKHRWIMHSFTSLMLIGMFTLIFSVHARALTSVQLIIALCVVSPISVLGYFDSKNELQRIFDKVFNRIKIDYNIILD